jgi:hypothetical protein
MVMLDIKPDFFVGGLGVVGEIPGQYMLFWGRELMPLSRQRETGFLSRNLGGTV